MTIRERFAKYSTEELQNAMVKLEAKLEEIEARMESYKAGKNIEFYEIEKAQYEETLKTYNDVECAYLARENG